MTLHFEHLEANCAKPVPKFTVCGGPRAYMVRANPTNGIDEAGYLHGIFGHTSANRIKEAFECGGLKGKTFGTSELRKTFTQDSIQFECTTCGVTHRANQKND